MVQEKSRGGSYYYATTFQTIDAAGIQDLKV